MNAPILYGQSSSEKIAEENLTCRQIVQEIYNFGVSQRQIMFLIFLLASELENVEHMRSITHLVRNLRSDTFISGAHEDEIIGDDDGSTNI